MVLVEREGKWIEASLTSFENEAELQQILVDSPDLIQGLVGAAVAKEMIIPGVGRADLVAVNEAGEVWLVECKLKASQEARKAVIGQILAYAGGLRNLGYEEFDKQFSAKQAGQLLDLVSYSAAAEPDADTFRHSIEETLEAGRFRLVIAVDQITDELKTIVEFVNATAQSTFSLTVLEFGYLHEGSLKVLVPQTYGAPPPVTQRPRSQGQRSSLVAVEDAVAQLSAPARGLIAALMEHAKKAGAIFKGGLTRDDPTGGFFYRIDSQTRSLWSIWSANDGILSINFASVWRANPERAEELLNKLRENTILAARLAEVQPESLRKFPKLNASELAEGDASSALLQGFDAIIDRTSQDASLAPPARSNPPS